MIETSAYKLNGHQYRQLPICFSILFRDNLNLVLNTVITKIILDKTTVNKVICSENKNLVKLVI